MDITPYLGIIVTIVLTAGGTYATLSSRLTRIETRQDGMDKRIDSQIGLIERIHTLERDLTTAWSKIDALREKLEERK